MNVYTRGDPLMDNPLMNDPLILFARDDPLTGRSFVKTILCIGAKNLGTRTFCRVPLCRKVELRLVEQLPSC